MGYWLFLVVADLYMLLSLLLLCCLLMLIFTFFARNIKTVIT